MNNEDKFRFFLKKLGKLVSRNRRFERVLNYIENWEEKFWVGIEEVFNEQVEEFSSKLAPKLGVSTGSVDFTLESIAFGDNRKEIKRVKSLAQPLLSPTQIKELNETIEALSSLMEDQKKKHSSNHFILIDGLDEAWVREELKYPLIRALVKSLQAFGRIQSVKLVIAMRSDLFEAVKKSNPDPFFQSEKLEGLIVNLIWTKGQLEELINKRIGYLYKYRYTTNQVGCADVFPDKIGNESFAEYIISRSLYRPRDVIAFVNSILKRNVNEKLPLTEDQIRKSERSYSNGRIDALCDEWKAIHPMLNNYLNILAGMDREIKLEEIDKSALESLCSEVNNIFRDPVDEVEKTAGNAFNRNKEQQLEKLSSLIAACLYKVGIVGIKTDLEDEYEHSYKDDPTVGSKQLTKDTELITVPMIFPALSPSKSKAA